MLARSARFRRDPPLLPECPRTNVPLAGRPKIEFAPPSPSRPCRPLSPLSLARNRCTKCHSGVGDVGARVRGRRRARSRLARAQNENSAVLFHEIARCALGDVANGGKTAGNGRVRHSRRARAGASGARRRRHRVDPASALGKHTPSTVVHGALPTAHMRPQTMRSPSNTTRSPPPPPDDFHFRRKCARFMAFRRPPPNTAQTQRLAAADLRILGKLLSPRSGPGVVGNARFSVAEAGPRGDPWLALLRRPFPTSCAVVSGSPKVTIGDTTRRITRRRAEIARDPGFCRHDPLPQTAQHTYYPARTSAPPPDKFEFRRNSTRFIALFDESSQIALGPLERTRAHSETWGITFARTPAHHVAANVRISAVAPSQGGTLDHKFFDLRFRRRTR